MIDWLTDTLLATSILMALVLLVREPVRRQFGPSAAYGLWLIPVLRLIVPPLPRTVERPVLPGESAIASFALGPTPPPQAAAMAASEPSLIAQLGGWESLALTAWLVGVLAMLLFGVLTYRRQRRDVLRDSVQVARIGGIRMVRSMAVRGPMAFGIVDRVIAVPSDFDERYQPTERRLALAHEIAHHRSGDLLVNHFAFALLCLQWFNPLAWLSHLAFRFDQEAACDARVLAKVSSDNRVAYAHAITKAATGRALLFAGALDRPGTLHRRLQSMLTTTSSGRRSAGKAVIAMTAATALPLTASWATYYVDVPNGGALAPAAAVHAAGAAVAPAPASGAMSGTPVKENGDGTVTLAGGVTLDKGSIAFFANDDVLINGKVKRVEQLTPAERSRLRATIIRSQRELARDRAELPGELAELRREADRARSGELRRELMQDREDSRRDLAEIESEAKELRANGEDPEKRKAEILRDLHEAETVDIDTEIREAIEAADPRKLIANLQAEEQQMARLLARLDQLERR